jgi:hypothetical protein
LVLKVEPPPRTSDEHGFPHWLKKSTWCLQHACLSTPKTGLEQIDLRVW